MKAFGQPLSWAVEILILAVVIYQVWKLLQGTRGVQVLTGLLIVLVVLTLFSAVLHLRVVTELIRLFSPSFFVALIVLFQPELRQVLAEVGRRSVTTSGRQLKAEVIEHIVNAAEICQRERIGALISLEREDLYGPARDTGTILDAKLSADLLVTIFYPRTPLHDGGVVIRDNRLVAAAAVFPLSETERLERPLGLRHRAALGLSEMTDAVVIVVSEETGGISIAFEGKLERHLDRDRLRARLTEILV
ncbi:Cyclic di-AMP synthase CdaA [Methylacidimicrobium sp. AP8]|uniref:diadenylate cyclase CdaA n=1 Tax=Methylacidimicrobium sp. AP8 TaxID=2730359 RepID=UPI0018C14B01|nr:diadenylate cyclase CdaA [Methylacidimicrobium sp. AP8]CAB4244335.1 Cyclic di-AMP synthase CdaA [Methylacidimicrobium sp. AP8]